MKTFHSDISDKEFPVSEKVSAKTIRHSILDLIQKEHPQFSHDGHLARTELNHYRAKYIRESLVQNIGVLTPLENTVIDSLTENTTLTDKIEGEDQKPPTFGKKVSDRMASFGGSWTFIMLFGLFIVLWIAANVIWLLNKGFDPYPFILLNLILSCLAAI